MIPIIMVMVMMSSDHMIIERSSNAFQLHDFIDRIDGLLRLLLILFQLGELLILRTGLSQLYRWAIVSIENTLILARQVIIARDVVAVLRLLESGDSPAARLHRGSDGLLLSQLYCNGGMCGSRPNAERILPASATLIVAIH